MTEPHVRASRRCALALLLAATGCTNYLAPRYVPAAMNQARLAQRPAHKVALGAFRSLESFDSLCRLAGFVSPPDDLGVDEYIRHALEDELALAGWLEPHYPHVTLTGELELAEFSSMRAIVGSSWTLQLRVHSSNGRALVVSEEYESSSGLDGMIACKQTAEALMPAVQDLLQALLKRPQFSSLLVPAGARSGASDS